MARGTSPLWTLALAASLGAAACSTAAVDVKRSTVGARPEVAGTATVTPERRAAEAATLGRASAESSARAIALYLQLVERAPKDAALLVRLARAEHFHATAHVALADGDHEDELIALYDAGAAHAERALRAVDVEIDRALAGGRPMKEALLLLDQAGVEAAFWYGANLRAASRLRSLSARLDAKDAIRVAMESILALDPDVAGGGPDRELGALYAMLPSIAGRDLDRAEAHFEASARGAPAFLETRVVEAEILAAEREDPEMFARLLRGVLAEPAGDDPETAPENEAARSRARWLLGQVRERFPGSVARESDDR